MGRPKGSKNGVHSICREEGCEQDAKVYGLCPKHARRHDPEWKDYNNAYQRAYRQRIKDRCYEAYGGYKCSCPKCDETEPRFLSIDHIENNGNEHRKIIGYGNGSDIYRWLIKHNFPEGFQVLCMNCNFGKARNGGVCPHLTQGDSA